MKNVQSSVIVLALSAVLILLVVGMLLYLHKHRAYMMMAAVVPLVIFALLVAWCFGMFYLLDLLGLGV